MSAAFCEDFDGGRSSGSRNGDLSSSRFSLSRWRSEGLNTGANYVGRADVSGCRSGLGLVLPPNDSLICDPSSSIGSRHAIVATAQQDYGDNLVRINQPFDISGRTGTFAFDLSLPTYGLLGGFPNVFFTQDPMSAPSYLADNSGGPTPRHGVAVQFKSRCGGGVGAVVLEFDNHQETIVSDTSGCPAQPRAVDGRLNRIEMRISQSRIELWASQPSSNGVDFGPLELMYSGSISLPFSRGYLYFGVHNHATVKYMSQPSVAALWDNLVFDGPRVATTRVAQVANASFSGGGGVDLSYPLSESGTGTLSLPNVVKQNNARLVFNSWADVIKNPDVASYEVQYRFNGGTWRSASLTSAEIASLRSRGSGSFSWTLTINPADLRSGSNTIELRGRGFGTGAGARVGNIDLVTW